MTTTGFPTPALTETVTLPSGRDVRRQRQRHGHARRHPDGGPATYPLTITAANGVLPNATQSFTLTVNQATQPAITSATSTTFTVGTAGSFHGDDHGRPDPGADRDRCAAQRRDVHRQRERHGHAQRHPGGGWRPTP